MQLHHLTSPSYRNQKTRVGRGGKRGTTSGRGQKGQKSRSGHRIRPASRDLFLRIPKRRGFRNKPATDKPVALDISLITAKFRPMKGAGPLTIDRTMLQGVSLVSLRHRGGIKVLGTGTVDVPLVMKGIKVSKRVREQIEKAGGTVNE